MRPDKLHTLMCVFLLPARLVGPCVLLENVGFNPKQIRITATKLISGQECIIVPEVERTCTTDVAGFVSASTWQQARATLTPPTPQVPRRFIGTDAFQETPIIEVTRQITKHNYLVMDVNDIARIVKEAFYLARTGRPGELPAADRGTMCGLYKAQLWIHSGTAMPTHCRRGCSISLPCEDPSCL